MGIPRPGDIFDDGDPTSPLFEILHTDFSAADCLMDEAGGQACPYITYALGFIAGAESAGRDGVHPASIRCYGLRVPTADEQTVLSYFGHTASTICDLRLHFVQDPLE